MHSLSGAITMAINNFIVSTPLKQLRMLSYQGRAIYLCRVQILSLLQQLGPDYELLFARPVYKKDSMDWYVDRPGEVKPLAALPADERASVEQKLNEMLSAVQARKASFSNPARAELLNYAVKYPNDSFVYALDGCPVLTCWGFEPTNVRLAQSEMIDRSGQTENKPKAPVEPIVVPVGRAAPAPAPQPQPAPVPVPPPADPALQSQRPSRTFSWGWLKWLLGVLLGLLLLMLLLSLLRGCSFSAPSLSAPDVKAPEISLPDLSLPDINGPNIKVPDISGPDIKAPNLEGGNLKLPSLEGGKIGLPSLEGGSIELPKLQGGDIKLPGLSAGAAGDGKSQPSPDVGAFKPGTAAALVGNSAISIANGLVDDSGRPVRLSIQFDQNTGKAVAFIEESGQTCKGEAAADLTDASGQVLVRMSEMSCPNGNHYPPFMMICGLSANTRCVSASTSSSWSVNAQIEGLDAAQTSGAAETGKHAHALQGAPRTPEGEPAGPSKAASK